jgi:hypothetical protein
MSNFRVSDDSRTRAEGVLMHAIEIVQRYSPSHSSAATEDVLDQLLEVLDGPEAKQVYETLKAGRQSKPARRERHLHRTFVG